MKARIVKDKPTPMHGLDTVLKFGKYQGRTVKDVIDTDRAYIEWCRQNIIKFVLNGTAEKYFKDAYQKGLKQDRERWESKLYKGYAGIGYPGDDDRKGHEISEDDLPF